MCNRLFVSSIPLTHEYAIVHQVYSNSTAIAMHTMNTTQNNTHYTRNRPLLHATAYKI
mgnify:CR=1 FL=1